MAETTERKRLLAGAQDHALFYLDIAREVGLSYAGNADMLDYARNSTDPYLNDRPLSHWDSRASALMCYQRNAVIRAFKARGDFCTPAGLVCLVKCALRRDALVPSYAATLSDHFRDAVTLFHLGRDFWVPVTEEQYWDALEVLPPRDQAAHGFISAEPFEHADDGTAIVGVWREHGDKRGLRVMREDDAQREIRRKP